MNNAGRMTIDYEGVRQDQTKYFQGVIERLCRVFIDMIRTEIPIFSNYPAGKAEWRSDVRRDFRTLSLEIAGNVIDGKVGLPYAKDSREYIIAMIIDKGHSGEIWTRPGEMTYDDNMYLHRSGAQSAYHIPQFEQSGVSFMDNATARMRIIFDIEMGIAVENIPQSIFIDNVNISN